MAMAVEKEVLPRDIIKTILLLLPFKSLRRFRNVSKSWKAMFSDHEFAKIHLQQSLSISRNRNIFLCKPLEREEYHVAKFEDNGNVQVEAIRETPNHAKDFLCSGDGLILLSTSSPKSYLLWNPFTKQKANILCNHKFDLRKTVFGISRGPSLDDYKIVAKSSDHHAVYSCKNGVWSEKIKFPFYIKGMQKYEYRTDGADHGSLHGPGLFVDGFSFWVMIDAISRILEILYFDPRDEKFKKLKKPREIETEGNNNFALTSLRGCLCLYDNINAMGQDQLRVWMLKDNNVDSYLWSEIMIIKDAEVDGLVPWSLITPLFFTEKKELVVRSGCLRGEIGMINSMEKRFEEIDVSESSIFDHDSVTVPFVVTCFFPISR